MRNVAELAVLMRFNDDSWQWRTLFGPPCMCYFSLLLHYLRELWLLMPSPCRRRSPDATLSSSCTMGKLRLD